MNDYLAQVFSSLKADRFRTLLSLAGVAVGIFSIVAALTLVGVLQRTLADSFDSFGGDLLFVEREPLEPDLSEDGVFRWWEYASRPAVTWEDYRYLAARPAAYSQIAFVAYGPETVGVAGSWPLLINVPIATGRSFSPKELENGLPVVLTGADTESRPGETLWLDGCRYEVIGVFEKAGMTTVCPVDVDKIRLVPFKPHRHPFLRGSILLSGADPVQVRAAMRERRRLSPLQRDDFSLNRLTFLRDEIDKLLAIAARLGWIIGLFSLLAGGFGIANMLYVSVEERKQEIGIRRAIGAGRRTIVGTFLGEAAVLSLAGGTAGTMLAQILLLLLRLSGGRFASLLPFVLPFPAVFSGLAAALLLGLLFGTAPARAAARLHPVEAMRGR